MFFFQVKLYIDIYFFYFAKEYTTQYLIIIKHKQTNFLLLLRRKMIQVTITNIPCTYAGY